MATGAFLEMIRWNWPRASVASYHNAGANFVAYTGWILRRNGSTLSLDEALLICGAMAIVCGAFIFFRRGWWWWAEHRSDREVTHLDLK
jgi:hypothetical protein